MSPRSDTTTTGPGAATLALGLGLALLVGAGVTLWASEGAAVFAETAFAAFIACF